MGMMLTGNLKWRTSLLILIFVICLPTKWIYLTFALKSSIRNAFDILSCLTVRVEHRLVLFYLANDVIQYSKRKRLEFVESWATALQKATTMVR